MLCSSDVEFRKLMFKNQIQICYSLFLTAVLYLCGCILSTVTAKPMKIKQPIGVHKSSTLPRSFGNTRRGSGDSSPRSSPSSSPYAWRRQNSNPGVKIIMKKIIGVCILSLNNKWICSLGNC